MAAQGSQGHKSKSCHIFSRFKSRTGPASVLPHLLLKLSHLAQPRFKRWLNKGMNTEARLPGGHQPDILESTFSPYYNQSINNPSFKVYPETNCFSPSPLSPCRSSLTWVTVTGSSLVSLHLHLPCSYCAPATRGSPVTGLLKKPSIIPYPRVFTRPWDLLPVIFWPTSCHSPHSLCINHPGLLTILWVAQTSSPLRTIACVLFCLWKALSRWSYMACSSLRSSNSLLKCYLLSEHPLSPHSPSTPLNICFLLCFFHWHFSLSNPPNNWHIFLIYASPFIWN